MTEGEEFDLRPQLAGKSHLFFIFLLYSLYHFYII